MQFVIDNNANTLKGLMMTSGRSLTVYYYHGNDAIYTPLPQSAQEAAPRLLSIPLPR